LPNSMEFYSWLLPGAVNISNSSIFIDGTTCFAVWRECLW
jgi:hypothetical protein